MPPSLIFPNRVGWRTEGKKDSSCTYSATGVFSNYIKHKHKHTQITKYKVCSAFSSPSAFITFSLQEEMPGMLEVLEREVPAKEKAETRQGAQGGPRGAQRSRRD